MIKRKDDLTVASMCIRNGNGEAECHKILETEDEFYKKGRLFNRMILQPGVSIGEHQHTGDNEIFYILSGEGEYNDNGTTVTLKPGDVAICNDGETHAMINKGDVPLEFIALILFS